MSSVTIGLDVTTNSGYAILIDQRLIVGRIKGKSAFKQYQTLWSHLLPLVEIDTTFNIVIEDFVAFNGVNPKTNAIVSKMVGGWYALWEQHSSIELSLVHVKTVRKFFRKEGEPEVTKLRLRNICREFTKLTLSDDETDAIAMVLWRHEIPLEQLKFMELTRNRRDIV